MDPVIDPDADLLADKPEPPHAGLPPMLMWTDVAPALVFWAAVIVGVVVSLVRRAVT